MKIFYLASGPIVNPFSKLAPLSPLNNSSPSQPGKPIFDLLGNFFKMAIVGAALYSLFNFLIAGYGFISANGDPKAISKAWEKIYQSIIGLLIAAGSITIAAVIGYLIFKDATFLITPRIITPN